MTLEEAIAEVKSGPPYAWGGYDTHPRPHWRCTDAIIKAAASGDLTPASDARLAVALAYQKAAGSCDVLGDLAYEADGLQAAQAFWKAEETILAQAEDQDALAEVQALKADRDRWHRQAETYLNSSVGMLGRAEAAEAKLAASEALVERLRGAATDLRDIIRRNIVQKPGPATVETPDGKVHTGPLAEYMHDLLPMIADVLDRAVLEETKT